MLTFKDLFAFVLIKRYGLTMANLKNEELNDDYNRDKAKKFFKRMYENFVKDYKQDIYKPIDIIDYKENRLIGATSYTKDIRDFLNLINKAEETETNSIDIYSLTELEEKTILDTDFVFDLDTSDINIDTYINELDLFEEGKIYDFLISLSKNEEFKAFFKADISQDNLYKILTYIISLDENSYTISQEYKTSNFTLRPMKHLLYPEWTFDSNNKALFCDLDNRGIEPFLDLFYDTYNLYIKHIFSKKVLYGIIVQTTSVQNIGFDKFNNENFYLKDIKDNYSILRERTYEKFIKLYNIVSFDESFIKSVINGNTTSRYLQYGRLNANKYRILNNILKDVKIYEL
ncbi:hypothetical protein [Peptoniphilus porci]|uniref:Uncharacterized protein n=1 Tax=Peptoniphilus porci TaxID=2652280 RepID=A0A1U7LX40_9FIRM|nr:hypothetical protein [Peptoniphilus porci]OLR61628.1 hypothetical protein BIV18_09755 [Peptoniphilus porci]